MWATGSVLLLGALGVGWYLMTFNGLTAALNATKQSWSNVEVELKRRFELIGNLVEIVKGYARHESGTLEKIASLRNYSQAVHDAKGANSSQGETAGAIRSLFAISESYPELKASEQFLTLQKELSTTENRIAERRHAYNQTVNIYENLRESFPSTIVAKSHQFKQVAFFDAPDELANAAPQVSLS